ncbi:sulfurtransferase complex subunit TusC [Gallaecimonas pentaromativorans]|uniref:tRNA 2-thiouridine synthesizing protein C n=1 Tax=Gallaecimonas pentaromativorans TaxID=584787 RepID=A0A3N1PKE6_9GAMM|nr:sulfurtransferase complex subunit TusC [Gallaecimonas pentaromativorans]MED5523758.1 sulfurtransferase complex subunit TusC [Pseudomonadota bacterium]ROQ27661.1 tRNA 2-thiouridine synthesizing protein C [Gallaecimonas pentaromativorans]
MVDKAMAVIFTAPPFAGSFGREALDTVLAASAYEAPLSLIFTGDALWQLVKGQDPLQAGSKDYLSTFKALALYDIDAVYVSQKDLAARQLTQDDLSIEVSELDDQEIRELLATQDCIYRF